jgi:anti-anti-sigma regulatory factor
MTTTSAKFSYFFNVKRHVGVVTFSGHLTSSNLPQLQECLNQTISDKSVLFIIINYQGLSKVSDEMAVHLCRFQDEVRKEFSLFICGIPTYLERVFVPQGIIRENEVYPDLLSIIQVLLTKGIQKKRGKE